MVQMGRIPDPDERPTRHLCCARWLDGARCESGAFRHRGGTHRIMVGAVRSIMVGAVRTPELSGLMAPRRRRRFCTDVPEKLSDLPVGSFIVDRRGRRTIAGAVGL